MHSLWSAAVQYTNYGTGGAFELPTQSGTLNIVGPPLSEHLFQFNLKSVQLSAFVQINEAHLFIIELRSTTLIEHTLTIIQCSCNNKIL